VFAEPACRRATGIGTMTSVSHRDAVARLPTKPPNTTEWIAPMRAHASIANAASAIIGM
jgi:hypothetical protein